MAVTSEISSISYAGNGSSAVAYAIPFLFYKQEHIEAIVTDANGVETELDLTSDFTVTGEGDEDGGTLTTTAAWDNTHTIIIRRSAPVLQPFVFEEGQRLGMKTLEKALDWIVMHVQKAIRIASDATSGFLDHLADLENPHAVTKDQVGLGSADNTSDADKPVSSAAETALGGKANLAGGNAFTGNQSIAGTVTSPEFRAVPQGGDLTSYFVMRNSEGGGFTLSAGPDFGPNGYGYIPPQGTGY